MIEFRHQIPSPILSTSEQYIRTVVIRELPDSSRSPTAVTHRNLQSFQWDTNFVISQIGKHVEDCHAIG
jgi:hypothetical protein